MDRWLIVLRIVHIESAMAWFGGAIIGAFFLLPVARALGPASEPFMDQLMRRRRMAMFFPIVAALTILAGAALYWRNSDGFSSAWVSSPSGLAFAIGGLAAIGAFIGGMILIGPSVAEQAAVRDELAARPVKARPRANGSGSSGLTGACGLPTGSTCRSSFSPA